MLYVYDGGSTSAPLLNAYSGNFLPPVLTVRNPEGKLTFRFVYNASVRLTVRFECQGLRLSNFYGEITCVSPTAARQTDKGRRVLKFVKE